jgi:hypothetical protein
MSISSLFLAYPTSSNTQLPDKRTDSKDFSVIWGFGQCHHWVKKRQGLIIENI